MWLAKALIYSVRAVLGAAPRYIGAGPRSTQCIYFANHSSHIDTLAIWSALPDHQRPNTRPVAALDYWGKGRLRRYVALNVLNALLVDRAPEGTRVDPLKPLKDALEFGDSLIIFPEGTRGSERLPGPFKSGLFHLARAFPNVELVPIYLENLHLSMPRGTIVPVPIICTVRFGPSLAHIPGESLPNFLARARAAVVELA